jgi:hypothetical protein
MEKKPQQPNKTIKRKCCFIDWGEFKPVVPQQSMLPTQQTKKFHKNKTKNTVLKKLSLFNHQPYSRQFSVQLFLSTA